MDNRKTAPSRVPAEYFCKGRSVAPGVDSPEAVSPVKIHTGKKMPPLDVSQSLFLSMAKRNRWSVSKVEEITMEKAFGRSVVSSSFLLFEATFSNNGLEKKRYALVSSDGCFAQLISSCSQFNKLAGSLDRGPRSKPDTLLFVRTFLLMTGAVNKDDVIIGKGDTLDEKQLSALDRYFTSQAAYRLTKPIFVRKKDKDEVLVSFWTWRRTSGLLRRHVLRLDLKGTVIEYTQEKLAERAGVPDKI